MARVWRGTFVEEGNLKFQVGALRRALGDGRGGRRYIATSAGQGYRFVAPVSVAQAPAAAALPAAPTRQNHNLPQQLTRLRQGPGFRPANALDRPPGASFSESRQIQRRAELIGPTQRLLVADAQ